MYGGVDKNDHLKKRLVGLYRMSFKIYAKQNDEEDVIRGVLKICFYLRHGFYRGFFKNYAKLNK